MLVQIKRRIDGQNVKYRAIDFANNATTLSQSKDPHAC